MSDDLSPPSLPEDIKHICKICDVVFLSSFGVSSHMRHKHKMSTQEYYNNYILIDESMKYCKVCNRETRYRGIHQGYDKYCSKKCSNGDEEYRTNLSIGISKTIRERKGEVQEKYKQTCLLKYGVENYSQTEENRLKQSDNTTKRFLNGEFTHRNHFTTGFFYSDKNQQSLYYRSSYELKAYELLEADESIMSYESEPFTIPYIDEDGIKRRYIPDILVTPYNSKQKLIEVKPRELLSVIRNQLKIKSAKKYCEANNLCFEVWTEQELSL